MFDRLKKIQENMEKAQKKLESQEFTSHIGNITIVMQGSKQVVDVRIKDAENIKDLEFLQENILLSFNDVLKKIDKASEDLFFKVSQEYE
ncbi:YbaB/EbfC family nucleoid-associated protein [Candidatus Phytoplasma pini]|uniref:Nucleoid-associated protein n=1 Tax=Candidatus Phytoplasma pini TaxID=267362 RepID=A0A559KJS7_9MOLU|nr:YbaB/EbfC family nucleoid-associated protein [Candidatus Phytoplasma pini]TVY12380.1 hypothetical protein MDPP_00154 [Candidatus Phytoplasma pini]